ncbi:hypothetical protein [Burkholderia phage vB_BglM_WTB]
MRTIHKFVLKDTIGSPQAILMPEDARPLSVGYLAATPDFPDGTLNVWALVDTAAPKRPRWFAIQYTGSFVTDPVAESEFVGRIEIERGFRGSPLQLHVFDLGHAPKAGEDE